MVAFLSSMNVTRSLLLLLSVGILLSSCSDEISSRYPDKAEAMKQGGLVEKGWMPEELPDTARDISESHDLDVNTGAGSFTCDIKELASYRIKMQDFRLGDDQVKKTPWLRERKGSWEFFKVRNFVIGVESKTGEGFWSLGSKSLNQQR